MLLPVVLLAMALAEPPPAVHFSPKGGCTAAIVAEIGKARTSIKVQAYSFTSKPIAAALNDATDKRHVAVSTILDGGQLKATDSQGPALHSPVAYDFAHAIAHNKVMVIDERVLITGSFNFTDAAELHNAENLLVIHSRDLARLYLANWQVHLAHSRPAAPIRKHNP